MKQLLKTKHGAGGFKFSLTENKGNTRLGLLKRVAIIRAIQDSWTEGVYQTQSGLIKRQLLNGNAQYLTKENGKYYFS